MEDLADRKGDDERAGSLRMRQALGHEHALTLTKGYLVLEDDMTMSLEEFSSKYAREDGEPECVHPSCASAASGWY